MQPDQPVSEKIDLDPNGGVRYKILSPSLVFKAVRKSIVRKVVDRSNINRVGHVVVVLYIDTVWDSLCKFQCDRFTGGNLNIIYNLMLDGAEMQTSARRSAICFAMM